MEFLLHTIGTEIALQKTQLFGFSNLAVIRILVKTMAFTKGKYLCTRQMGSVEYCFPELLASLYIYRLHMATIIIKIIDACTHLCLESSNAVMCSILFDPQKAVRVREVCLLSFRAI